MQRRLSIQSTVECNSNKAVLLNATTFELPGTVLHLALMSSKEISFNINDAQVAHFPYKDVLVIALKVANFTMRRLLVDKGSSANIIFWLALEAKRISWTELEKSNSTLFGFDRKKIESVESIKLPVTANSVT